MVMNTLERALELAAREMENGEQVMAISGAGSVAWQPAMSLAAAIAWAAKNATAQIVYVIEEKAGGGWRAFSTGKAGKGEAAARLAAHRNGISRYTGALSSYRVRIGVVPGGPGTLNLRQVERTLIRDSRNISRGMRDRGSDTKPFEVPKGGSVSITHTGPMPRVFQGTPVNKRKAGYRSVSKSGGGTTVTIAGGKRGKRLYEGELESAAAELALELGLAPEFVDVDIPGIPGRNYLFSNPDQARAAALRDATAAGIGYTIAHDPRPTRGQPHFHVLGPDGRRVSGHYFYGRKMPRREFRGRPNRELEIL